VLSRKAQAKTWDPIPKITKAKKGQGCDPCGRTSCLASAEFKFYYHQKERERGRKEGKKKKGRKDSVFLVICLTEKVLYTNEEASWIRYYFQ
jgi:hypothetical protein